MPTAKPTRMQVAAPKLDITRMPTAMMVPRISIDIRNWAMLIFRPVRVSRARSFSGFGISALISVSTIGMRASVVSRRTLRLAERSSLLSAPCARRRRRPFCRFSRALRTKAMPSRKTVTAASAAAMRRSRGDSSRFMSWPRSADDRARSRTPSA